MKNQHRFDSAVAVAALAVAVAIGATACVQMIDLNQDQNQKQNSTLVGPTIVGPSPSASASPGACPAAAKVTVTLDNQAPTVKVGQIVSLTAAAFDAQGMVIDADTPCAATKYVQWMIGGQSCDFVATSASWDVKVKALAPGPCQVFAAVDAAGGMAYFSVER